MLKSIILQKDFVTYAIAVFYVIKKVFRNVSKREK